MKCDSYIQPVFEFRERAPALASQARRAACMACSAAISPGIRSIGATPKSATSTSAASASTHPRSYYALRTRRRRLSRSRRAGENTRHFRGVHDRGACRPSSSGLTEPAPSPIAGAPRGTATRASSAARDGRDVARQHSRALWSGEPMVARRAADRAPPQARPVPRASSPTSSVPTINIDGRFEPDVRDDGLFAVGAGHVGVTSTGLEQYDAMARGIAAQVVDEQHRGTLVRASRRSAAAPDDACAARFFAQGGAVALSPAADAGRVCRRVVALAESRGPDAAQLLFRPRA